MLSGNAACHKVYTSSDNTLLAFISFTYAVTIDIFCCIIIIVKNVKIKLYILSKSLHLLLPRDVYCEEIKMVDATASLKG